jgi:hypothetical protein
LNPTTYDTYFRNIAQSGKFHIPFQKNMTTEHSRIPGQYTAEDGKQKVRPYLFNAKILGASKLSEYMKGGERPNSTIVNAVENKNPVFFFTENLTSQ